MADPTEGVTTQPLSLTQELILMLLNEETGYFHQVPGWHLNCAVVGAVLAELSSSRGSTRTWSRSSSWTRRRRATRPWTPFSRNRGRTGSTEGPILDRTARSQGGVDHRCGSGSPGGPRDPGVSRRRILDAGSYRLARGTVRQVGGRHGGRVHQDADQQGHLHRPNPRSERCHHNLPRQYLRRLSFHIPARRGGRGAHRIHLQDGPDRPLPGGGGLSEPRRPGPPTSYAHQEDSDGFPGQAAAEPACPRRQPQRALREPCEGVTARCSRSAHPSRSP